MANSSNCYTNSGQQKRRFIYKGRVQCRIRHPECICRMAFTKHYLTLPASKATTTKISKTSSAARSGPACVGHSDSQIRANPHQGPRSLILFSATVFAQWTIGKKPYRERDRRAPSASASLRRAAGSSSEPLLKGSKKAFSKPTSIC